jgi:hypothetical protein
VLATDREELAFVVIDPQLRRVKLEPGDVVSVRYQVRGGGQLVVTEITRR